MNSRHDVIIIGGGFAGLAIAYRLARRGASVLLLEAGSLGRGPSGACAGRAQISEGPRGPHMDLVLAGLARLETLEAELGADFEWRRLGNLMLIEHERHWQWWTEQVAYLQQRRLPAEMLDPAGLAEAEPLLQSGRYQGAAWCLEGHLNPFKLMRAYAGAARDLGAELRTQAPVDRFEVTGGRIRAVAVGDGRYAAEVFILAAGAWTGELSRRLGYPLPVQFTHAEAVITEPLPPLLHNHVGLADFYETIHNARQAVSIGVAQQMSGALLITEAVAQSPTIHHGASAWGAPAIANAFLELFPALARTRLLRAWAAPSPFLPDELPAIGWLPGLANCLVATCFLLTITTMPVLSDVIAGLALGEEAAIDLSPYDPARFRTGAPKLKSP